MNRHAQPSEYGTNPADRHRADEAATDRLRAPVHPEMRGDSSESSNSRTARRSLEAPSPRAPARGNRACA